uniref:EOG090X06IP n=1 Tax=Lynceus sp. MCZ IZ 141354 TaxID=1930659 RepID=A0A9N6WR62_9CRUS|nr:EOG090X06IP [Lynceus sp. MCZ IZ 141354]
MLIEVLLKAILYGFVDSLRGSFLVFTLDTKIRNKKTHAKAKNVEEPKVLHRILQCCALNGGVFWLSLLAFYGVLLPLVQSLLMALTHVDIWLYIGPLLNATFSTLWVLPLFLLSRIVNSLWFQDIADLAYKHSRGRSQGLQSWSKLIADVLFSTIIQALFLVQAMILGFLPIPGLNTALSLLHMCLLYSLYSFEYRWYHMGWELPKRLTYIELHWPYFLGFGLPLTLVTYLPSSFLVSGCVFSILFPVFIISGNEAQPFVNVGNYPLRLFTPVVTLANTIFQKTIGKASVRK